MKFLPRINPVTLKELRQLVRSRIILWGMAAFPIVLMVAMTVVLSSEMHSMSAVEVMYGKGLGEDPLLATAAITGIVTCGLLPMFTAIKAMMETGKSSLGLEFTTALTPAQIASGKIASAAIISAIAVALAMPFFALSYLMRGVELSTTLTIPVLLFAGGVAMTSLGLIPACARSSIVWKIVLLAALCFVLWMVAVFFIAVFDLEMEEIGAAIPWSPAGVFAAIFVPAAAIAYGRAQAASELAPPHTDFNRPLRTTQMALFAAGLPLVFAKDEASMMLEIAWILIAGMVALGAAFSPTPVTRGVVIRAPRSRLLRILLFPFVSGSVPSMVFAILLATAASAVLVLHAYGTGNIHPMKELIVAAYECGGVLIAAGALARILLADHRRVARIVGRIGIAYIVMVQVLYILSEAHVVDRKTLFILPCNIDGVDRMFDEHVPIAFGLSCIAILLLACAAKRDFAECRRGAKGEFLG